MRAFAATLVVATVLAACAAPASSGGPSGATAQASAPAPASAPARASALATAPTGSAAVRPAFLSYAFTDVRDGKQFQLTDFAGRTVLVIGMAVW